MITDHPVKQMREPQSPDLIRESTAEDYSASGLSTSDSIATDPLTALVGSIDAEPVDDIDEVIYRR